MKKLLRIIPVVLMLALSLSLISCNAKQTTTTKSSESPWAGKKLAVANISLYDEWTSTVGNEFVSQAKALGFGEINNQDGNLNAETQQAQVENFIAQKFDMILIDNVSPDAIQPTLDKAAAAGIPVIAFDSPATWSKIITQISWDNAQDGILSAQWVAKYAKANLGGKVLMGMLDMNTVPHVALHTTAFKTEIETLLGKDNVTYVWEQDYGNDRVSAANVVSNNINKKVDFIFGANEEAAQGAVVALTEKAAQGVKVISGGAWGSESFSMLVNKNPYYIMAIVVDPKLIVQYTLQAACDYFSGKTDIAKLQNIPVTVVDASNIADYAKYVKK